MSEAAQSDKDSKTIELTVNTISEGLKQGSIALAVPIRRLDFEVIEKGSTGFMRLLRPKKFKLLIYESDRNLTDDSIQKDETDDESDSMVPQNGEVFTQIRKDGLYLKITPAVNGGAAAYYDMALNLVSLKSPISLNKAKIRELVKSPSNTYVKVGEVEDKFYNNVTIEVTKTDDESKGYIKMGPPTAGGVEPHVELLKESLKIGLIIRGIKEDVLESLGDYPVYNMDVLVAEAVLPEHGKDGYVKYHFETESKTIFNLIEVGGRVDFKSFTHIQNVREGDLLGEFFPATEGTDGRTITGTRLPARPGRDLNFKAGANVAVDENGKIHATKSGRVRLDDDGLIAVDEIYIINGNLKSNINNFEGTVVVKGDVENHLKITAQKDVFIEGTLSHAQIFAGGDIVIRNGINGDGSKEKLKVLECKGTLWSKYIYNATVEARGNIMVSGGIMNSDLICHKDVICMGKRASIIGGHILAKASVYSSQIGSKNDIPTVIEVAVDPDLKRRAVKLTSKSDKLIEKNREIDLKIKELEDKMKKNKDKKTRVEVLRIMSEISRKRENFQSTIDNIDKEIDKIKEEQISFMKFSRISAEKFVFVNVRLNIGEVEFAVTHLFDHSVTFKEKRGEIEVFPYEKPPNSKALEKKSY